MLRAPERQPAQQKRRLIEEVTRLAQEEFPPGEASNGAEVTGFFVLLTNLIESMLRDQWTTFAAATAGIFLMMLVAFRSLKLALIALVPNAIPVFVVMGVLGWLGLAINMGAAMIAAVSMGLSVDSSIHYLVSFRRARRAGKGVAAALAEVQQSVGQAVIFSTAALIVGFSVLVTSQFVPTIYFGALVSLAMLGGLLGNLIILPLLLSWVERDDRH
jgi:predicted RND superfamily exporter protein